MSERPKSIEELKAIEDKPVVVVDERSFIAFVNTTFVDVYGWNAEEAVGQSLTIIIPESLHEAHHMGFSRFLESEEPKILDMAVTLRARDRAGREFDAEHYIIAEKIEGVWEIGATVTPL